MTREEQLAIANEVLPILHQFNATGQAKADHELRQKVKQLYSSITGIYMVDVACNTCLVHYLNVILSWQDRTLKQITKEQMVQAVEEVITDTEPVQEVTEEPVQESKPEPESCCKETKKGKKKKG